MNLTRALKFGFIGTGNMSQSIIHGLIDVGKWDPKKIFVSNRSAGKQDRIVADLGVQPCRSNEELIDKVDVVFLCMKPQDLVAAIEPIGLSFEAYHRVFSLLAGVNLQTLRNLIPSAQSIVRLAPNLTVRFGTGVVGYCVDRVDFGQEQFVEDLLSPLGKVIKVQEGDELNSLTVATSSGVGFLFEIMSYMQDWLEDYGFEAEQARDMIIETTAGAAELAKKSSLTFEELQNQVASKKGMTAAGLWSIRENQMERILRIGFEKAMLKATELGKLE
ncbi:MAG: pyrroline-5-carboxylate reductase [Bdellovibrionales bacterium CG10_big_fil_rev_8_21_14_0_10_45_34]|nr:MAG: pyrroline-5-carboxylate reductase [Bdellovibrionales bacterium CG10_big_fil_rev_8_21_14_0_10_45_34]